MSSSQPSNSSGNPTPSSVVTTTTPPPTPISSIGYPTPQQVPFGYGYASHHQGYAHVLQQPDSHYQSFTNRQHSNPQLNPPSNFLPQASHPSHQAHPSYPQPNSQSRNLQKKPRKPRVTYTEAQLAILEERFKQNKYISTLDYEELGKTIGVSKQQVKVWFMNRRQKARIYHISQLSSSQPSNPSENPTPSSAVTTTTPPTPINSISYPTPQQVPLGYGYASHHQEYAHVLQLLQQPDFHYEWANNQQLQRWAPQLNPHSNFLPHQPSPSHHHQSISHFENMEEISREPRVIYTTSQLAMLEERYKQDKYIQQEECIELGKTIGITERQIKSWFRNRRYNAKKEMQKENQKKSDEENTN